MSNSSRENSKSNNIIYTYINCSKETFKNEVSFNEEDFSIKLSDAFGLNIQIDRIKVVFDLEPSHANNTFKCTITIVSPEAGFVCTEKGKDPGKVSRAAIYKVIRELHDKNKQLHNHS